MHSPVFLPSFSISLRMFKSLYSYQNYEFRGEIKFLYPFENKITSCMISKDNGSFIEPVNQRGQVYDCCGRAYRLSVPTERSPVPASFHCGGGKPGSGTGDFSRGMMYESGCRKCFPMMFSRLILTTITDRRINVPRSSSAPLRLAPRVLDVGLSCARVQAAVIVSRTASIVQELVQIGLDVLGL